MQKKIISKNAAFINEAKNFKPEIAIKLPDKYSANPGELVHLNRTEENALFSYLINEFFRQIEKQRILAEDCISELSFLCESYFDFQEYQEETRYPDEFEPIYSEY